MTLDHAIIRNPYDPKKGNKSAYCRYLRYNVDGWYLLDSKEVRRRLEIYLWMHEQIKEGVIKNERTAESKEI